MMDREANLAQIAISFCLAYDAVSTVIPRSLTLQQLRDNIASTSKPISKSLVKKLETFYKNDVKNLNLPW